MPDVSSVRAVAYHSAPMLDRLQKLADKAKSLPKAPGVYMMKDDKGRVIYVGKSASLPDRGRHGGPSGFGFAA